MKRISLLIPLAIFGIVGLGIHYSPKAEALGADRTCRVNVIIDRSGSVGGQISALRNQLWGLFGPVGVGGVHHDRIHIGFWSFSRSNTSSGWHDNWKDNLKQFGYPEANDNAPFYGYVPSNVQDGTMHSRINQLRSFGTTNYGTAFGKNNPYIASQRSSADVIVFLTDGSPNPEDSRYNGRAQAQTLQNSGVTVIGGIIPNAGDGQTPGQLTAEVNFVVNNNWSQSENSTVFRIRTDYQDFTAKVASRILNACNYNLTPSVNLSDLRVDPSQNITVTGNVNNNSLHRRSDPTEWSITRIAYLPGTPGISLGGLASSGIAGKSTDYPCARLTNKGLNKPGADIKCRNATVSPGGWKGGLNSEFPQNNYEIPRSDTVPTEVGSIVCYFLSLRPAGFLDDSNMWIHSNLACTIVAKSPHIHIQGGDLRVIHPTPASGLINSGTNGAGTIGSWVEYGVFSTGQNSRVSSASTGSMATNTLTFRNTPVASLGNFTPLSASDIASYFTGPITGCPATINIASIAAGQHDYNCSSDVGLSGNLNAGASITIRTTGKITITGNIGRPATYGNIKDVPQLVVLANKIHIRHDVTSIDAWLLATGAGNEIDTCYDQHSVSGQVGSNDCNQPLVINGPVKTDKLRLFRTAGAGSGDPNVAAETFNLRPDTYLWLYLRSNNSLKLRTNAIHELPPRY